MYRLAELNEILAERTYIGQKMGASEKHRCCEFLMGWYQQRTFVDFSSRFLSATHFLFLRDFLNVAFSGLHLSSLPIYTPRYIPQGQTFLTTIVCDMSPKFSIQSRSWGTRFDTLPTSPPISPSSREALAVQTEGPSILSTSTTSPSISKNKDEKLPHDASVFVGRLVHSFNL